MVKSEETKPKGQASSQQEGSKTDGTSKQGNNAQQSSQRAQGQKGQQKQGQKNQSQQKKQIGWPEWITFGIGLAIILGFVGLQIYLHLTGESGPPRISVQAGVSDVHQEGNDYYLPVQVINEGGQTAEDINVQLTLQGTQGKAETVSFKFDFLAPNESSQTTVVFKTDPSQGELTSLVTFKNP